MPYRERMKNLSPDELKQLVNEFLNKNIDRIHNSISYDLEFFASSVRPKLSKQAQALVRGNIITELCFILKQRLE